MPADRDHEATMELILTVRDEMRRGFDRLEEGMGASREERTRCQQETTRRLTDLEHWRERIGAIYAVVAAVVSAVVAALTAWISGRHS